MKGALFRGYNATALRFALRRSARIAVLSRDHAEAVPPLAAQLRRRPQAIDEVPERGRPGALHARRRPAIRRRYGIDEQAVVAIVCASLDHAHANKRVDLAIEATARARGRAAGAPASSSATGRCAPG